MNSRVISTCKFSKFKSHVITYTKTKRGGKRGDSSRGVKKLGRCGSVRVNPKLPSYLFAIALFVTSLHLTY